MSSDCVSTENKYFAGASVVVATVFKFIKKLIKKCGGGYGVLRGFSLGGFAPQTPHQGGSAPLDPPKYGPVTPQDGLVTPPLWELRADLFKKRPKSLKNASFLGFCVQDGLVTPQNGLVTPPS